MPVSHKALQPINIIESPIQLNQCQLRDWGYKHKTVCHAMGEYARYEDGDGFCEVHVNTFGHSYAPGFGHIEAYRRKNCCVIRAFSSLFTTFAGEEKPCCRPWPASFSRLLVSTPKRRMSQMIL